MGKRIVVTGANRGIGKEICRQLAALGHEVILTARSEEKGKTVAKELGVAFMQLDTSDGQRIRSFTRLFRTKYQSLDECSNSYR